MLSPAPRPRVLMVAFACDPKGSGERWLGWGWAEQAAKSYDVTLLTWDRFAKEIEAHAKNVGVRPVCVGVPALVNWMGDRSGPGRWLRQIIWHRRAAAVAVQLHARERFALVHQTTFHTFRIPFRTAGLGIASVWGPIAGGEVTPPGFGPWLGGARVGEALRGWLNRLALAQPGVQKSLRRATAIFVSNHTTLNFLPAWCHARCTIVPPNALRELSTVPQARAAESTRALHLLFVGNCVATRAIPLVLEALRRLPDLSWRLTVVGAGSALDSWKAQVKEMSLTGKVVFTGAVPRSELARHYAESDVFVFPALRDSGGSGLLEAMSLGLPVVCCDWGGPAEMVDEQSGIKVSVASPEATIAEFAAAFKRLHAEPQWCRALGVAAYRRTQREFSWEKKRTVLEATYARCLRSFQSA